MNTIRSSRYTWKVCQLNLESMISSARWKVAGALVRSKCILIYEYNPVGMERLSWGCRMAKRAFAIILNWRRGRWISWNFQENWFLRPWEGADKNPFSLLLSIDYSRYRISCSHILSSRGQQGKLILILKAWWYSGNVDMRSTLP